MNGRTLLLLVLAVLITPSCLSQRTKENVILPAGVMAWPGLSGDVERGIATGEAMGDLTVESAGVLRASASQLSNALESKDFAAIKAVDWLSLAPWAERGIQNKIDVGEISVGVASSLRERVINFTHLMGMLQGKIVFLAPSTKRRYYVEVPGVPASVYAGNSHQAALIAN